MGAETSPYIFYYLTEADAARSFSVRKIPKTPSPASLTFGVYKANRSEPEAEAGASPPPAGLPAPAPGAAALLLTKGTEGGT